jgi:hypothetical protein
MVRNVAMSISISLGKAGSLAGGRIVDYVSPSVVTVEHSGVVESREEVRRETDKTYRYIPGSSIIARNLTVYAFSPLPQVNFGE